MNQRVSRPPGILLLLAFLAVYLIWGTTYLAIRYGLLGMKPFVLNSLRYGIVAIILFAWCAIRKLQMPNRRNVRVLATSGLLMLAGGTGLVASGEQYINSGSAAVIIATEPLMFLLFDKKNYKSYSPATFIGMTLGFTGIFIFGKFTTGNADTLTTTHQNVLIGTVMVLISAFLWVIGTLYLRRQQDNSASPVANAAYQHLAGALACILVGASKGDWKAFSPAHTPAAAWIGLVYLIIFGSVIAFLAFMFLVRVMPPAIVSTHTYINPIVAVIAGWLMAGEQISGPQLLALGMVLLGVLLVQAPKIPRLTRRRSAAAH
jgi:drug/metabolite transporter (DMT)-like permease